MSRDLSKLSPCQRIERSLQKKYRDTLWGPFIAAVKEQFPAKFGHDPNFYDVVISDGARQL